MMAIVQLHACVCQDAWYNNKSPLDQILAVKESTGLYIPVIGLIPTRIKCNGFIVYFELIQVFFLPVLFIASSIVPGLS